MAHRDETKAIKQLPTVAMRQSPIAAPVINTPDAPSMEKVGEVKTVVQESARPLMGTTPPLKTDEEGRMPDIPQRPSDTSFPAGTPQTPKHVRVAGTPSDGYVRLEIHVQNGKLSLTGIHEVSGPLTLPTTVARGYAYEVLINDQPIALGSLPDTGVRRAFANREVPGPEGKHRFIAESSFDFFARVPRNQISETILPQLMIVLHDVRDAPDRFNSSVPLLKQAGVDAREVGRLSGIKLGELQPAVRSQLERILNVNARPR